MLAENAGAHAGADDWQSRRGQRPRNPQLLVSRRDTPKLNPGAAPFLPLSQRTTAGLTTRMQGLSGVWRSVQPAMNPAQPRSLEKPSKPSICAPAADMEVLRDDSSNSNSSDCDSDGASEMSDTPQQTLRSDPTT